MQGRGSARAREGGFFRLPAQAQVLSLIAVLMSFAARMQTCDSWSGRRQSSRSAAPTALLGFEVVSAAERDEAVDGCAGAPVAQDTPPRVVVAASLVSKATNLAGLVRTCEVLGAAPRARR